MHVSASSMFITIVMVSGMILFLRLLLCRKRRYYFGRPDVLILLSLIILVRLSLPMEFPFTITIGFGWLMNPLQAFLRYEIGGASVGKMIVAIWGIGSTIVLMMYMQKLSDVHRVQWILKRNSTLYKVSDFMDVDSQSDYSVWKTSLITAPMVLGFQKIILLPEADFSLAEMQGILYHEMQHIQNHDVWIKQILNILVILYWWFLPIYWLKKEIQLAMELRVDERVTRSMSEEEILDYASALVNLKKRFIQNRFQEQLAVSSNFFIYDDHQILSYRISYLLDSKWNKKTNKLLVAIIAVLPIISHSIILEPHHPDTPETKGTWSEEELVEKGKLIHHADGNYSIYIDEQIATIKDVHQSPFASMPVIEKGKS